ncbi:LacI family DNA-binding transcriptional regulator [Bifidobacterium sp. ESL0798]|uniref:LacI family DNA-binding transcriptional regulator n=1 Tax=Bifidobacterium sp. ESL0798 TaxID=2983235 RepID=UPI0023F74A6E|nr:LacI family DNA-binding transcriptional regulator [Bifidobacterium sp. ESL0798]WEV74141.1 LacI family DNA-binding transcriptional regulator [Bifidobacterium sp. ESL0798]
MAGIKDVAKAAGVSVSTVSYVLSGKRPISSKTTDKVLKAIDELGYIPDASAQKMRGRLNHIIAISEPMHEGMNQMQYSAYFMQSAWQARSAGYDVLFLTGPDAVDDIERVTHSNLVDGVLLLDVEERDARVTHAARYRKPCVAIGLPKNHRDCACIDIDFAKMGRRSADRLFALGHRRVVLLRAQEIDYERRAGYVLLFHEAFLARASEIGLEVFESGAVDNATFDARKFVADMLVQSPRPTALVSQAGVNILNLTVTALMSAGLKIPEDISVLSCGTFLRDEPMRRPVSEEPFEPEHLCSIAMGSLVSSIEKHQGIAGQVTLIDPKFIDRGSLASAPQNVGAGDDETSVSASFDSRRTDQTQPEDSARANAGTSASKPIASALQSSDLEGEPMD